MNPGFGRGFAAVRANRYPVRAAIEVGVGSAITTTVARIDAPQGAIQEVLFHHSLDIPLKERPGLPGVVEPACWPAITNALRMSCGSVTRFNPSEFAGLLSLNPAGSNNITRAWQMELKIPFHCVYGDAAANAAPVRAERRLSFPGTSPFAATTLSSSSLKDQLDRLAFHGAAAAAQCTAPHTMLLLREDSDGVALVGLDDVIAADEAKDTPAGGLLTHVFPFNSLDAHLEMVQQVQRRSSSHAASSPNPCTADEFWTLAASLEKRCRAGGLPDWVMDRLATDSPIVCFGPNGGLWNVASRAVARTLVGLDTLQMTAAHKYCGLTDVLLGQNYPHPRLVVPQLALAVAVMRCLDTVRVQYLPDVGVTHAMLVEDAFWTFAKEASIKLSVSEEAERQRHFDEPRVKFDPTRAQVKLGSYNAYEPNFANDERQWKPQFEQQRKFRD